MTREQILLLLATEPKAVERAILAIYARQTAGEQQSATTREQNGRGFNAYDARPGTYYAEWILKGRRLTGDYLNRARRLAGRYVGQLATLSEEKLQSFIEYHRVGSLATLDPFQEVWEATLGQPPLPLVIV